MLRQVLEGTHKYAIEVHHIFVDFKSVYYMVDRTELYGVMREINTALHLIRLVKETFNIKSKVKDIYFGPILDSAREIVCFFFYSGRGGGCMRFSD